MAINLEPKTRVSREGWASVDGHVQKVTGYRCDPNTNYWWCPAVGYSMAEGAGFFKTETEANYR